MSTSDDRYRAFVQERRGELLRTSLLLTAGDRWAAEDLVQTALTRLYVAWPRVRPETADAYVRRALLNALIDHRRLAATRREHASAVAPERPSDDPSRIHLQSAVFRALAQLSPRMRAAVVMRHLLDLSVEETAAALGCRRGTVKSQTARGLDQLRALLEAEGIAVEPERAPASSANRAVVGVTPANDPSTQS